MASLYVMHHTLYYQFYVFRKSREIEMFDMYIKGINHSKQKFTPAILSIIPEASHFIIMYHTLGLDIASLRAINRSKANSPHISASTVISRGFASRQRPHLFLSVTTSRRAMGPIRSLIQWVPRVLPPGVKRTSRAARHATLPRICLHPSIYGATALSGPWPPS